MPASFRAAASFTIPERQLFVICGDVIAGTVKPGMIATVTLNSSLSISAPIHSVEHVRTTTGSQVGLTFKAVADDELQLWKDLNIADEIVDLSDAPLLE